VAEESGNIRTANIVMLGAVSRRLDIAESFWLKAVEKMVPSRAVEVNLKAFLKGRSL